MTKRKRIGFTIGMMLLMGGWGLTWYAHEQQQAYSTGWPSRVDSGRIVSASTHPRRTSWIVEMRIIYAAGIMIMTVGAGVTAFTLPMPEGWK